MDTMDYLDCPYREGSILEVQLSGSPVNLEIKKRFEPVTFSPVVLATVQHTGVTLVAKFFDRRYNPLWRKNEKCSTWNEAREEAYRQFVLSGEADVFIEQLYNDEIETDGDWTPEQEEVNAFDDFQEFFENETRTYSALEWMQGQNVPKMLGTISYRTLDVDKQYQKYFEVEGVLLEYVEGFSLSDLTLHAPRAAWADIIDEALLIVNIAGTLGVHNRDMSVHHMIVRPVEKGGTMMYQPVLFDFGLTRLREDYDSEEDWMQAKCTQDEEGAIGTIMARRVRQVGGTYAYKRSYAYGAFEEMEHIWRPPRGSFPWRTGMQYAPSQT